MSVLDSIVLDCIDAGAFIDAGAPPSIIRSSGSANKVSR